MDNRKKILDSALRLFATRGYDATGVQEIVKRAGLSKPTLYHYFGSKQGLLEELVARQFANLTQAINSRFKPEDDLEKSLTQLAWLHFEYARDNEEFYKMLLIFWYSPQGSFTSKTAAGYMEKNMAFFVSALCASDKTAQQPQQQKEFQASSFMGLMNTYIGMAFHGYLELTRELAQKSVRNFLYGIV